MKISRLSAAAAAVFVLSHVLPAYQDAPGFTCLRYCWDLLFKSPADAPFKWVYYVAFVPTNLVFVAALALGWFRDGLLRSRFIATSAAFFHVLSWLLMNVRREDIGSLTIGYYLWLLAYALLLASQIRENRAPVRAVQ